MPVKVGTYKVHKSLPAGRHARLKKVRLYCERPET